MNTWQDRAKKRLKDLDLYQYDLISVLGVTTRGAVGHYLSGRREMTPIQVTALAKKLQCSIDWLLTGEQEKTYLPLKGENEQPDRVNDLPGDTYKNTYQLRTINWHEISNYLSSNNDLENRLTMLIDQKLTEKAYGIEIPNNELSPIIKKGQIAVIEPDSPKKGRTCLVRLNGDYKLLKHVSLERQYLQAIDGLSPRFPIDEEKDCQIIGVLEYILTPAIKVD